MDDIGDAAESVRGVEGELFACSFFFFFLCVVVIGFGFSFGFGTVTVDAVTVVRLDLS